MINLLPSQEKEILRQEEEYKLVLILGILFFIFLICLILILLSIKIYFSGQLNVQEIILSQKEESFKKSRSQDLEEKILLFNQTFSELSSYYSERLSMVEISEKISQNLPYGVHLTNFNFDSETRQISLSGFSPSREILLEFKENLGKEENFQEIYFSPSSWVKPADIDFTATLRIKTNYEK